MLTTVDLTKRYQTERTVDAVAGVDLEVKAGEFVAIVGRSGSGKSSLLAMIGGLTKPTSGKLLVEGEIGFVFQFPSLLPSLRAIDNVALPALVSGTHAERESYQCARMLLEEVGLGKKYDFYPNELSGGEQRRVAIARALINSPKLLLADEPTADLDEETEQEILELLLSMRSAYGLTLVVVTHNMLIAEQADRILRMKEGKIVATEEGKSPALERKAFQPKSATAVPHSSLGIGFDRFVGRLVLLLVPLIACLWLVNFGITKFEAAVLSQQEESRRSLEDLALSGLRAEVKGITFSADGAYDVALYLRNTTGEKPIYVLTPAVRGFVQVGNAWHEVPMTPINPPASKLMKVTGEDILHYRFLPTVTDFTQLIAHYMHVRISNDMLVSGSSQPKSDLIERNDNYYVYLKPKNADDTAILKALKFPGKPPVWIPMPPH